MRRFRLQQLAELHHSPPKLKNYSTIWWDSAPPPIPVQETIAGRELAFCPRSSGMTTTYGHLLNTLRELHKEELRKDG